MHYKTTYVMTQDTIDKLQMAENKTKTENATCITIWFGVPPNILKELFD